MPEIDTWVLRRACDDIALLSERLGRPMPVWVNVSSPMFSDPRVVDVVEAALAAAGLPSEQLGLEITEGVLMQNAPVTLQVLERLKNIGIRLTVDDFGTGYSSLAYLKHFPVDGLKIDRGVHRRPATRRGERSDHPRGAHSREGHEDFRGGRGPGDSRAGADSKPAGVPAGSRFHPGPSRRYPCGLHHRRVKDKGLTNLSSHRRLRHHRLARLGPLAEQVATN